MVTKFMTRLIVMAVLLCIVLPVLLLMGVIVVGLYIVVFMTVGSVTLTSYLLRGKKSVAWRFRRNVTI